MEQTSLLNTKLSKVILFVAIIGIMSFGFIFVSAAWADGDFDKCKNITITNGDGTLTGFPFYINLSKETDMQEDYDDLRFYSEGCSIGGDLLNYEIESYTATQADIWVKTTLTNGENIISVYYGNAGASSGENPEDVWNDNYKMVQHMDDYNTSYITDSTLNKNNGTKIRVNEPIETSGKIGFAQNFDGEEYIAIPGDSSLEPTNITISLWIKLDTALIDQVESYPGIISKRSDQEGYSSYFFKTDQELQMSLGNGTVRTVKDPVVSQYDWTSWHQIGITYNSSELFLYIDDDKVASYTLDLILNNSDVDLWIGDITDYAQSGIDGSIDEVRISNTSRSADWINQSYQLVENQDTYFVEGSEESGGGTSSISNKIQILGGNKLSLAGDGRLTIKA